MQRKRLKLEMGVVLRPASTKRPKAYLDLRYWWLHELRQLRAKRRISGSASKTDIKIAQRELARLRREHV